MELKERVVRELFIKLIGEKEFLDYFKDNIFSQNLGDNAALNKLKGRTYGYRTRMGNDYHGDRVSHDMWRALLDQIHIHLYKKPFYGRGNLTNEEVDKLASSFTNQYEKETKENRMSVEAQNVNVPIADVQLVYGKEIKQLSEGELISLISQIEEKKKIFSSLNPNSKYYLSQIEKINEAKSIVEDELDSRV